MNYLNFWQLLKLLNNGRSRGTYSQNQATQRCHRFTYRRWKRQSSPYNHEHLRQGTKSYLDRKESNRARQESQICCPWYRSLKRPNVLQSARQEQARNLGCPWQKFIPNCVTTYWVWWQLKPLNEVKKAITKLSVRMS